jgi:hypothetical protein
MRAERMPCDDHRNPLRDRLVQLLGMATGWQLHGWEPHADQQMVVGRRSAIPHLATPKTAMDDHLLAIAAEGGADRFHQTAAFVFPIARRMVDMLRMQAERAMVPMPPAADRRTHKGLAMTALELFGFGLPARRRPVGPLMPAMR